MYRLADGKDFTEEDVKHLHRIFYRRISEKDAGVYRTKRVVITGSKYPTPLPERLPVLMEDFVIGARKDLHPVLAAAKIHKDFVFISHYQKTPRLFSSLGMNGIL